MYANINIKFITMWEDVIVQYEMNMHQIHLLSEQFERIQKLCYVVSEGRVKSSETYVHAYWIHVQVLLFVMHGLKLHLTLRGYWLRSVTNTFIYIFQRSSFQCKQPLLCVRAIM